MKRDSHSHIELPLNEPDPIIRASHYAIRFAVKLLAILMVIVIFLGIGDVLYVLYQRLTSPRCFCSTSAIFLKVLRPFSQYL